jgi:3-oxoacyl-[acyl-carrier-protein] synthase II
VSSLGEGLDAHWDALNAKRVNVDETRFAPYIVHPLPPVSFDSQIPKRGDQRQMETWQRLGVYAAGLALDSAGVKGNQEILSRMDMIVAAGGGERDVPVDMAILKAAMKDNKGPAFLNERLMNDLRPTLFLAQLSNLLAGNIAIVHGVCGTSRTFMGEEAASIDAARIARARIENGESDIALIGASHNGERTDLLILYEFGDFNLKGKYAPLWARNKDHDGFALGSAERVTGAGIARARGSTRRQAQCQAEPRVSDLAQRKQPGRSPNRWTASGRNSGSPPTMATDLRCKRRRAATSEEKAFLQKHPGYAVRSTGTIFGHTLETQFPLRARSWRRCLSRAVHCFRPTIPPVSRLKRRARRPRLWSKASAIGRAKASPWSRRSSNQSMILRGSCARR